VIERMFALIDVLASREEAISLKEISEKTGLHPSTTHRILNDLATAASWTARRRAATGSACACWNWATW
jgi:DNA-binding IclR family transcriptional regulator